MFWVDTCMVSQSENVYLQAAWALPRPSEWAGNVGLRENLGGFRLPRSGSPSSLYINRAGSDTWLAHREEAAAFAPGRDAAQGAVDMQRMHSNMTFEINSIQGGTVKSKKDERTMKIKRS